MEISAILILILLAAIVLLILEVRGTNRLLKKYIDRSKVQDDYIKKLEKDYLKASSFINKNKENI